MWAMPPAVLDLALRLLELLGRARDEQHGRAGVGDLERGRLADARGGAGDHHDLAAASRRAQRAVLEQVRVEVALPVVPEPVGVASSGGTEIPVPSSAFWVLRRVEVGRVVDVDQHPARDAELGRAPLR